MKLLQILVWILLFMISYDLVTYFLLQRNEGEPALREGAGLWSSILSYDGTEVGPLFHWLVGSVAVAALLVLRLVFKRVLATSTEITTRFLGEAKAEPPLPKKRESFLTCRISDTTINTYTDDQNYDVPGQLSPAQLQVLLEELKFSVDEKFEEIDAWIVANGHDLKLWLKRLERVETELSYIRHQIFILMSSNAKLGSTLCIGDVPETRDHVETLRDLSTILAQVKQQFHEDESKVKKVREYGDHGDNYSHPKSLIMQELNKGYDVVQQNLGPLKSVEAQQRNSTVKDVKSKQNVKKSSVDLRNYLSEGEETEQKKHQPFTNGLDSYESETVRSESRDDTPNQSEKDGYDSNHFNEDENAHDKGEDSRRSEGLKECPRNEKSCSPRHSPTPTKRRIEECEAIPALDKRNPSPDRKGKASTQEKNFNNDSTTIEPSVSTNLIVDETQPVQQEVNQTNKDNVSNPLSKRTVRFAHEKRDVSPSKSPTWLGIKREPSPAKPFEIKGGSDSMVLSPACVDGCNNVYRDSVSCPAVEDKRQSRRSLMEKELTNLERRASPSPTRRRKPNVRSKVAEYIRGTKNY